jgi:hypothetical protein
MKIKVTFEEEDIKKMCVKATQKFVNGTVEAEFAPGPYDRRVICEVETPDETVPGEIVPLGSEVI